MSISFDLSPCCFFNFQSVALIDLLFVNHHNSNLNDAVAKCQPLSDDVSMTRASNLHSQLQPNPRDASLKKVLFSQSMYQLYLNLIVWVSGRGSVCCGSFNQLPQLEPFRIATTSRKDGCQEQGSAHARWRNVDVTSDVFTQHSDVSTVRGRATGSRKMFGGLRSSSFVIECCQGATHVLTLTTICYIFPFFFVAFGFLDSCLP